MNFGATFHANDINFDGYPDFSVIVEQAASSGVRRSYWVYDPDSGIFVQNELTKQLEETWAHNIYFDPETHEINVSYFGNLRGCPNSDQGDEDRYRVVNNRLVHDHSQGHVVEGKFCTLTVSDLIDGTMRVTAVRRLDLEGNPVK